MPTTVPTAPSASSASLHASGSSAITHPSGVSGPPSTTTVATASSSSFGAGTSATAPPPLGLSESYGEDTLLSELSSTLKASLEVEKLPLGLDEPLMVLDLDSFVEAVSACVQQELSERDSLRIEEEEATAGTAGTGT